MKTLYRLRFYTAALLRRLWQRNKFNSAGNNPSFIPDKPNLFSDKKNKTVSRIFEYKQIIASILFILLLIPLTTFFYFSYINQFEIGSIREGAVGTYTERDIPEIVTHLLSSSLIDIDKDGLPKADLVKDWRVENEGKTYLMTLKDNLYWIDGTPLKAGDFDTLLPEEVKVERLDDKTLKFNLQEPFSPFLTLLTRPVFKRNSWIGTGPYKISQIRKDPSNQVFVTHVTLSPVNTTDLPIVSISFYDNEKGAKNALMLGEIQAILGVNELASLPSQKNLSVISRTDYTQLVTVFYNTKDAILSDTNLRLALSFGAPSIKDQVEAKTSIPPTNWAFNSDVKDFLDNPTQAKSYLGKVQNWEKVSKEKNPVVTLTATPFLRVEGERIIESWNKLGIKSVLRIESGIPQDFQALLITQKIPADPDQYSFWHSTQQAKNLSKLSDSKASPRIDKDLEDGRKVSEVETRKQKYHDFQRVLADNAPATFLYFPRYNVVYMKKIDPQIKKILDIQLNHLLF